MNSARPPRISTVPLGGSADSSDQLKSTLAATRLARSDASVLGICGAGRQAELHARVKVRIKEIELKAGPDEIGRAHV